MDKKPSKLIQFMVDLLFSSAFISITAIILALAVKLVMWII